MKDEFNKKHVVTAMYVVITIIIAVVAVFLLLGARDFFINKQYTGVFRIFTPFTFGFIMAYLLNPLLLFFEERVFLNIAKNKDDNKRKNLKHGLSILATYIVTILLITLLMLMVVPQVGTSVKQLAEIVTDLFSPYEYEEQAIHYNAADNENKDDSNEDLEENLIYVLDIDIDKSSLADSKIGVYLKDFAASVQEYIDNLGIQLDIEETFNDFFLNSTANIVDLTIDYIEPAFNATASIVAVTASLIVNTLLGIIISIYMLANKDKLIAQVKKLLYAVFPESFSNKTITITRKTHEIFGGFLTGKMLESFIVGIICLVFMSIFNINYAMLISVIVGITNMIPFFGPFIGAIPSIFFLLINDVWQAVLFAIFILVLQQIDGNYLGPKILGSTIGLSPFWIISSVLIMNGLFGIFGMFFGVPLFAIIYTVVKEIAENSLNRKGLPAETDAYILVKDKAGGIKSNQEIQPEHKEDFFTKIESFSRKVIKYIHKDKKDDKDKSEDK